MVTRIKTCLADIVRRIVELAREVVTDLKEGLRRLWRQHRDRLNNNSDYARAIGTAATAVAALLTTDPPLLAVVAAAVALYVAIHHAASPQYRRRYQQPHGAAEDPWRPSSDPWSDPSARWDDDLT